MNAPVDLTTSRFALPSPLAMGLALALSFPGSALAFSEFQDVPPPGKLDDGPRPDASPLEIPLPDPLRQPQAADDDTPAIPAINYDETLLPEPVQRMRRLIMEACKAGDIEALRPLLSTGENATQLSLSTQEGDPIAYLRSLSGDTEGHEILAILYEVLAAGYVQLDIGTPDEIYAWPYFIAVPLDSLTAPQRVELFKLVTAGDYEEMKAYGTYIFFRVGITPDGAWEFFVGGE